jgi:hypothetical protein
MRHGGSGRDCGRSFYTAAILPINDDILPPIRRWWGLLAG